MKECNEKKLRNDFAEAAKKLYENNVNEFEIFFNNVIIEYKDAILCYPLIKKLIEMNGLKTKFCENFKKKYYDGIDEYRKEYLGNNYEYLNFKRKPNKLISDYFKPNKKLKKSFEGVVDKINKKIINNNINNLKKNETEVKLNINLKEDNNINSNTSTGMSIKNNFNEFYKKISQTMEELKKDDEASSMENNNFFDHPLFDSNSQSKKDENINTLNISINNNNSSFNSFNKNITFKNFPLNINSNSNTYNINSNLFSKNCSFEDSNLGINSRLSCNTISSKITTHKKKVKKSNILTEKIRNKICQNNTLFKKDEKKSKRGNNNNKFDEDIKKFIQKKFYGGRKLSIDSNLSQNNEIKKNNNDDNQVLAYKTPEKILKHSLIDNKMSKLTANRNLYGLLSQTSNKLVF